MTAADEVLGRIFARLERVAVRHELTQWAQDIRDAFIPDDCQACDRGGFDDMGRTLIELCEHMEKLEGLLETHLAKPRWTITAARWSLTITRGG
jgi:hypothetical protein